MTVFLFASGAALAALGTRVCAAAFVAAAVLGARQSDPLLAALTTWTAAAAAGSVLLDRRSPRILALPALGATAVLAAAGAPNGAVVLGLWALGTVAVILQRGALTSGRRWAIGLAIGDVVFAVAIATTAGRGFEGWPSTLKLLGAIAMLVAAALRAPLAGGPPDASARSYGSALVVRAQTVVLLGLAASSANRPTLHAIVLLGAAAFAAGTVASRRATVDAIQELGLVGLAIGAAGLGWISPGWVWGALAAGTLMHHLRFTLGSRASGGVADTIGRGAGIGLPFLPVCTALLDGSFRTSSDVAVIVLLAILAGLAGRTRIGGAERSEDVVDPVRAWGPIAAAVAAAFAAPLLWTPEPPAGGAVAWPTLWALPVVLVAASVGSRAVAVDATDDDRPVRPSIVHALEGRTAFVDAVATDVVLWAAVTAVAAAAIVLWLVGLGRGFL